MRARRRTQVVKGAVCKTAMQRFDPARRLQTSPQGEVCLDQRQGLIVDYPLFRSSSFYRNECERIKTASVSVLLPLACAARSFHCFLKPRSGYFRGSCRRGARPSSHPARCRDPAAGGRAPTSTPPASVPIPSARSPMAGRGVR